MANFLDSSPDFLLKLPTLVDFLQYRAVHQPTQTAYTFLQSGETEEVSLTYQELDRQARAIAAQLQAMNLRGERALLLYPPGLEFIAAFFGCLYAGVVAVPAYPPRRNQNISRLQAIAASSQATVTLTTTSLLANIKSDFAHSLVMALRYVATDNIAIALASDWQESAVSSDTLAFLQYTSGSTGSPKGVMVSHGNLLHNSALIHQCFEHTPNSRGMIWLPLYHDMGLIGGVLQPLYGGFPVTLMSPVMFLQKPYRWLQAISRYQATTSGGPNFAYDLCVRKITPEQRANLDLSSWDVAFTGAEPVRTQTLERFAATFESCGFRWEAFYPCYGMAETTLLVSGGLKAAPPVVHQVQGAALEQNRVRRAAGEPMGTRTLVGLGRILSDQKVVIVDPESLIPCPPEQVGEIWVSGSSVAQGYWNRQLETEQTFYAYLANTGTNVSVSVSVSEAVATLGASAVATSGASAGRSPGPFLRTGDLGFLQAGELFVTGRLKDVIIIRGRNHYPQDIELTVAQSHPALHPSCGAAFGVEVEGEQLVVVQEVERSYLRKLNVKEVVEAIARAVSQQHELQVHAVLLLKPGSIPKTSSGKIQRHACRTGFKENNLNVIGSWHSKAGGDLEQGEQGKQGKQGKQGEQGEQKRAGEVEKQGENVHTNNLSEQSPPAPLPPCAPALSSCRADDLIRWLRSYANEQINSRLIDERRCIPPHIVLDLGNRGLLGMQVPPEYGGIGLGNYDTMRVLEQLGAVDPTLSLFVGLNNILGIRPILNYGCKAVRDELLPILATGRELAAFALTEPGAGSNPQAISARATPDAYDGWLLQGTKIWSGSAAWAGVINVFVQHQDANGQFRGISGFAVRKGTSGLRQGPEALTMGMRGMVQNTVYLDDVHVSPEQLLGEAGSGMKVAQDAMMYGRLAIAAASVGGMKRCAQLMLRYSSRRSISTGRLLDNPVILARLNGLTAAITSVENLVATIAKLLDHGCFVPVEAYAVCKTAGPEFYWQTADNLVQLLGGRGYIETNIAPQLLRDARVLRIFEGPTETLNMFLGSRVINKSKELQEFLCQSLGTPEVSQSLLAAAQQICDRCTGSKAPFPDRVATMRWASILIGEIATFAILLAALQGTFAQSGSERLRRAIAWTHLHFEQKIALALSITPDEFVLSSADNTINLISNYVETIGDLEQTLPGEDYELDELLRKSKEGAESREFFLVGENFNRTPYQDDLRPVPRSRDALSIQKWIVEWLGRKLQIPPLTIDQSKSFADYGLDSVMAVELAAELEKWLKYPQELEATIAWNFPTIESLARYLADFLNNPDSTSKNPQEISPMSQPKSQQERDEAESIDLEALSEAEMAELLAEEIATVKRRAIR